MNHPSLFTLICQIEWLVKERSAFNFIRPQSYIGPEYHALLKIKFLYWHLRIYEVTLTFMGRSLSKIEDPKSGFSQ